MIPTLVLSFAALAPRPAAFAIDCSSWQPGIRTEFDVRFVAVDGAVLRREVLIEPDAEAPAVRDAIVAALGSAGWTVRRGNGLTLVVEGTAKSPVRSVTWKSDQWTPAIRPVFAPPAKP